MYRRLILTTLALVTAVGCHRPLVRSPDAAFREIAAPPLADDDNLSGLKDAIIAQRAALLNSGDKPMKFGSQTVTRGVYARKLDELATVLDENRSTESKLSWIKDNFRFFEIYGGDDWGEILLTGYFEPEIDGSLSRTDRYSQPLYGKPDDLISIDLKKFSERFAEESSLRGRLDGKTVVPYYSRSDIDERGALAKRGLELCWVDPLDAFFLQIQGSGAVKLQDDRTVFITFAEKNGLKYEAIGKFLKPLIAPSKITMQSILKKLREMPINEQQRYMSMNPSYVFFRVSSQRAVTALGVPATPGRTIASDPKYAPKGALALLTFDRPKFRTEGDEPSEEIRVSRFVVDQDTGGAIKGTNRIDLFVGRGKESGREAGVLQSKSRIVYLVPR